MNILIFIKQYFNKLLSSTLSTPLHSGPLCHQICGHFSHTKKFLDSLNTKLGVL